MNSRHDSPGPGAPARPERLQGSAPGRFLLVRLGAIGDVTNALVVATAIKDACPGAHVAWAVHPLSLPLVDGHPSLDHVHVWPRGTGMAGFRSLVREVKHERYDVALDLQRLQKSSLLARLSGARRVLGFDRRRAKELSWLWTSERIEAGPSREHMVEQYLRFARRLGIERPEPRRLLPNSPAAAARAERLVAELGGPPVLLNLGASKPENRWPVVSFRDLIQGWSARAGAPPLVLTGGPPDRAVADELVGHGGALDLVGATSLPELWELARRSRAMLAADTGPMHLCAAVGTPVVALFGPSDAARTGPYGRGHVVLGAAGPLERDVTVSLETPHAPGPMQAIEPAMVLESLWDTARAGDARRVEDAAFPPGTRGGHDLAF